MTKAIIFDLGQVLIPFDWQRGYNGLAQYSPFPPEEIRSRIKESGLFDVFERGHIEPQELARRISTMLEMNVGYDAFCETWSSIFLPETLLPEDMLARLRAKYRLLLLSNTDAIHFDWVVRKYPIMRHFDSFVLSFKVGFRKPEPEIYAEAIARAGCKPEEICFADDRADNVEGALRAGIDAIQFQSAAQFERELRSRSLDW